MKGVIKVLAVLLLILTLLLGGAVLVFRDNLPANRPIVLSDGSTARLLGVTVGTNHVFGTRLQRLTRHLPGSVSKHLLELAGQGPPPRPVQTTSTNLVVWIEHSGNPTTTVSVSRNLMLGIPGERPAGSDPSNWFSLAGGRSNQVHSFTFESWPRRIERIECTILEQDSNYRHVSAGSFLFENPLAVDAPAWTPDPIPTVVEAGDLKITLLGFATGVGNGSAHRRTPDGGAEVAYRPAATNDEPNSVVRVRFDSPRGTNETWFLYNADLSDGSGNVVGSNNRSGMSDYMVFGPALWPDEPAWKVRLHMKRKTGFAPGELVSFTNIAVPPANTTNVVNQTNLVDGRRFVFKHLLVRPPPKDSRGFSSRDMSQFRVEHDRLDETNQFDLVRITVQPMGTNITTTGSGWTDEYHEYNLLSIPADATHLDFVFSVQKARFAEFVVDPNWITNEYVIKER